jgi:signal transduction histidine kinase
VVDNHGRITSFNHKFVEMWRIPDEVIAAQDDDKALSYVLSQLQSPESFLQKVRDLYAHPDAESHDLLEFADGRVFERYSKPQRVEGVNVGRVWSFRDVTERKRLDEMKDGFLSAVSHELRTPLTSVLGFAVTLQQRDNEIDATERSSILDRLGANARKLERLLTDILDLDRLGRGILEPRRQPTDVGGLVRRVIEEVGTYDHRTIAVRDEGAIAWLDQAKVERIVENLLTNAARHTPDRARIWVSVRMEGDDAHIVVEDEGPGVPAELRSVIFESFRQGPTAPSHAPGVGIGLSLVARFAELHGGRAWVEDRLGGGASFHVRLPSVPPEDVRVIHQPAAGTPAA